MFEEKSFVPVRVSERNDIFIDITLLLLDDGFTHHCVLITNFKALIRTVIKRTTNKEEILCRNYNSRWFAPVTKLFDLKVMIQPLAQYCRENQKTETDKQQMPGGFCSEGVC